MPKVYTVVLHNRAEMLSAEEIHTLLTDELEDQYDFEDIEVTEL